MSHSTPTNQSEVLTVGLDISDRLTHLCIVDSAGKQLHADTVPTAPGSFCDYFRSHRGLRFVLEAGPHSNWIARELLEVSDDVIVVNANQVRLIAESLRKTDAHDARTLAFLGARCYELLGRVYQRPSSQQADLSLVRSRAALVRTRTLLINSVRGTLKSFDGTKLPASDGHSFHKHAEDLIPEELLPAVRPLVDMITQITAQIRAFDKDIERLNERYSTTAALRQVKGVGPLTALTFTLVIGDPHRFPNRRDVAAYLGLVPRLRASGARTPQMSISKAGDGYTRQLLVECAHYIMGPFGQDSDLRRFGLRLAGSDNPRQKRRATIALARKLAVLLLFLWQTGVAYEPLYLAQRRHSEPDQDLPSKETQLITA